MKTPTRDRILDRRDRPVRDARRRRRLARRDRHRGRRRQADVAVLVPQQGRLWCRPCSIAAAHELSVVIDAAVRAATDDPLDRIEAVIRAVFRPAVRRPALLGLIREVSRLPSAAGDRLTADLGPLVDRAVAFLQHEMDAGRLRRADPRLVASLCYATVTGIATEPDVLRVRLATIRRRSAPPPQRAARLPPRRPRPLTRPATVRSWRCPRPT